MAAKCIHRSFLLVLLLLLTSTTLLIAKPTYAQPAPPDVPTLGPIVFFYYTPNNQTTIISPVNGQAYENPVTLSFSETSTSPFGQFGNIGYSLDGGTIFSVRNLSKSVDYHPVNSPDWYFYNTTAYASLTLPSLPQGAHNVTVYLGWQYLGIPENPGLERFEVQSMATIDFTVGKLRPPSLDLVDSPAPTVPELSITVLLVALIAVLALLVVCRRKLVTPNADL
jgi:hypothetical protein